MLTPQQISRVNFYVRRSFSHHDIARLAGCDSFELTQHFNNQRRRRLRQDDPQMELRSLAVRLLSRVPKWWRQGSAAWTHCVRMNFCDVL